jgi:hypothetical protein
VSTNLLPTGTGSSISPAARSSGICTHRCGPLFLTGMLVCSPF